MFPRVFNPKVPFCLPERLLTQLHNDGIAKRAAKQVGRLRSLYPDLMRSLLSHPKTAIYATKKDAEAGSGEVESDVSPMALVWAFAMVRSRAFASNDDRFALVPFMVRNKKSACALCVPERGRERENKCFPLLFFALNAEALGSLARQQSFVNRWAPAHTAPRTHSYDEPFAGVCFIDA